MTKRARTERREAARAAAKLADGRARLAALEPGGSPARPIDVTTASVIEPQARALPCLRCPAHTASGSLRLDAHEAVLIEGERLRLVRLACARCGAERSIYFRIIAPS
jgi:hypothetical protein